MSKQTVAKIAKPGHPFDGHEVIISHAGINRHPYLDSAYNATEARRDQMPRPVSVMIMGRGRPQDLLDTVDASELIIV